MDAFGDAGNRRFVRWWGPGSHEATYPNARHWGDDLWWLNPPFGTLKEVVARVWDHKAHAVLVAPDWPKHVGTGWPRKWPLQVPQINHHLFPPREWKSPYPVRFFFSCGHDTPCASLCAPREKGRKRVHWGVVSYMSKMRLNKEFFLRKICEEGARFFFSGTDSIEIESRQRNYHRTTSNKVRRVFPTSDVQEKPREEMGDKIEADAVSTSLLEDFPRRAQLGEEIHQ